MKNVITLLVMLLVGMQLQAQDWNFGVKGGINVASFTGTDVEDVFEARTGFHIGGLTEVKFSENLRAQLELLYSTLGAKADVQIEEDEMLAETTFKLDYIAVPVLFKYYPVWGLSFETGPQLSFETDSEMEFEMEGEEISLGSKDDAKSMEFAWIFGMGYDLPYGLMVQGRYFIGLSDVYDDTPLTAGFTPDLRSMKHSVIQISLGYKF